MFGMYGALRETCGTLWLLGRACCDYWEIILKFPETCKDFVFLEFCVFPTNLQGSCIYWKSPTQASAFTGGGEKVHLWRGGGGGPGGGGH